MSHNVDVTQIRVCNVGSRGDAGDLPRAGGVVAPVAQTIVEAAGSALPELPLERHETPATPVRWAGHVAVGELLVVADEECFEGGAVIDDLALR